MFIYDVNVLYDIYNWISIMKQNLELAKFFESLQNNNLISWKVSKNENWFVYLKKFNPFISIQYCI